MTSIKLPNFSDAAVLVVGDVMLDRYWRGNASRISPEAPVPVVRIKDCDERPGGAGNVALNLTSLDINTHLVGVIGQDEAGDTLSRLLKQTNTHCYFHRHAEIPTVTKLRVLSQHQQLIRLDFEEELAPDHVYAFITNAMSTCLPEVKVVILSDYGKGALAQIPALIKKIRSQNIPVLVDPKSIHFADYHGASLITPNYKEFEAVVGSCQDDNDIINKANVLLKAHDIESLLVTRGSQGMMLIEQNKPVQRFPAHARDVFDVTGAGDTVISVVAGALAAGSSLPDACFLANVAAGIVVGKSGAATVSASELRSHIRSHGHHDGGVVSEEKLLEMVKQAKAQGETIIMTNGCFDLLHAGHIAYLQQAKALGHRLIVAINDDESVAGLKGNGRPINPLHQRMQVLAALSAVDWVVPFSESTPERLISRVLPDILTKGGDYKPEDIAGGIAVKENGGEIHILPFVSGCSTTGMLEKIEEQL